VLTGVISAKCILTTSSGASRHGDNTQASSTHQPLGAAVGDNLHGSERSRGTGDSYPQSSTIGSSSHQSSTAPHTTSSLGQQSNTSTTQPHSSSLLNKLDPRVSNEQTSQSHDGRNAALGAGALGTGAAAYGASRHHDSHDPSNTTAHESSTLGSSGVGTGLGQASNDRTSIPAAGSLGTGATTSGAHNTQSLSTGAQHTAGPHSSDLKNRVDPTVDSDRSKEKDHNYGRDAALLGAGGAAGYGASKLHDNSTHGNVPESTSGTRSSDLSNRGANTAMTSTAPSGVADVHQPHTSTTTTTTTNTSTTTAPRSLGGQSTDQEHRHHHGKEAAAVGAAGTAAYGAHELSKDDEKEMLRLREQERAKEAKESEKFHEKERKKSESGGLFSFLSKSSNPGGICMYTEYIQNVIRTRSIRRRRKMISIVKSATTTVNMEPELAEKPLLPRRQVLGQAHMLLMRVIRITILPRSQVS